MSRGLPSMTALLGLLAVAGFQNKDKIGEWLGGLSGTPATGAGAGAGAGRPSGIDGVLESLRGSPGGAGGMLTGGLADLVDRFRQSGHGETVDSWVTNGPNKPAAPQQVEGAIGSDVLATLEKQTGLSRDEILARLSRELPQAVDRYTPEGRLPA